MIDLGDKIGDVFSNPKTPVEVAVWLRDVIDNNVSKLYDQNNIPDWDEELVSDVFGGQFYLVETVADLKLIPTVNTIVAGANESLFDVAADYDTCAWLTTKKNFVQVFLATNNAGGDSWFIPKNCVTQTVLDSIDRTGPGPIATSGSDSK